MARNHANRLDKDYFSKWINQWVTNLSLPLSPVILYHQLPHEHNIIQINAYVAQAIWYRQRLSKLEYPREETIEAWIL
ncbi:hypothetical protein [Shewanella benthica]|uniref:hypothetical protein n=1 Tax=Shewanella benthica TaxID=43661 RepID=UPI000DD2CE9B|nr:hypothetical protein [Shewanella benthica]